MAELKVISTPDAVSEKDIIEFLQEVIEIARELPVTSIGFCLVYGGEEIDHAHISVQPQDQDLFERAALELRHSIIDSLDDWQVDLLDEDQ